MKKFAFLLVIGLLLANTPVNAKTINEADTELCETVKMALISSNREPVDKAITKIYRNDKMHQKILLGFRRELKSLR